MNSVVTKRFVEVLRKLKKNGNIRSFRQLAVSLEYAPQSLSDILNGKRDVTIELLRKAVEKYKIDINYLFTGQGGSIIGETRKTSPVLAVITNNELEERIAYVPVSAMAGYGNQLNETEYMQELPTFSLPGYEFSQGTFRCFDISGDSMEPMLKDGDKVVCNFVELDPLMSNIIDNHVYVVVTTSSVVVKRIVNRIKSSNELVLVSENSFYGSTPLDMEEIREIWQVKYKISRFSCCAAENLQVPKDDINGLKQKINQQSHLIKSLNDSLELLLKRSRSVY